MEIIKIQLQINGERGGLGSFGAAEGNVLWRGETGTGTEAQCAQLRPVLRRLYAPNEFGDVSAVKSACSFSAKKIVEIIIAQNRSFYAKLRFCGSAIMSVIVCN